MKVEHGDVAKQMGRSFEISSVLMPNEDALKRQQLGKLANPSKYGIMATERR